MSGSASEKRKLQRIEEKLASMPRFVSAPHRQYGRFFQYQFTPCCIPFEVVVWWNSGLRGVFLRILFPSRLSKSRYKLAAIALNRINYEMAVGSFAFDANDGELRYKNAMLIGNGSLSERLFEVLVEGSHSLVQLYLEEIYSDVYGYRHDHRDK